MNEQERPICPECGREMVDAILGDKDGKERKVYACPLCIIIVEVEK